MDALLTFLFLIVGGLYFGIKIIDWLVISSRKKKEDEKELNDWLQNTESKFRDLHVYPEDWGMRRKYIAKLNNYTCNRCGNKGWLGFHIHHKVHLSQGGTNDLANLEYLCKFCHESEHPHMREERIRKYKEMQRIKRASYYRARRGYYT